MHTTHNIDDGYIGSGIVLRNSIAKYGLDCHIKTIIRFCNSREELAAQEALLITEDTLTDPLCMNLKKEVEEEVKKVLKGLVKHGQK